MKRANDSGDEPQETQDAKKAKGSVVHTEQPELVEDMIVAVTLHGRPRHDILSYATPGNRFVDWHFNAERVKDAWKKIREDRAVDIAWLRRRQVSKGHYRMINELKKEALNSFGDGDYFLVPSLIDVIEHDLMRGDLDAVYELFAEELLYTFTCYVPPAREAIAKKILDYIRGTYPTVTESILRLSKNVAPEREFLSKVLWKQRIRLADAAGRSPLVHGDFIWYLMCRYCSDGGALDEMFQRRLFYPDTSFLGAYFIGTYEAQPALLRQRFKAIMDVVGVYNDEDAMMSGLLAKLICEDDSKTYRETLAPYAVGEWVWPFLEKPGGFGYLIAKPGPRMIQELSIIPFRVREEHNADMFYLRDGNGRRRYYHLATFGGDPNFYVKLLIKDPSMMERLCKRWLFGRVAPTRDMVFALHRVFQVISTYIESTHELCECINVWLNACGLYKYTPLFYPHDFNQAELDNFDDAAAAREAQRNKGSYERCMRLSTEEETSYFDKDRHIMDWRGPVVVDSVALSLFDDFNGDDLPETMSVLPISYFHIGILSNPLVLPSFTLDIDPTEAAASYSLRRAGSEQFEIDLLLAYAKMCRRKDAAEVLLINYVSATVNTEKFMPPAFFEVYEHIYGRGSVAALVYHAEGPNEFAVLPFVKDSIGNFLEAAYNASGRIVSFDRYCLALDEHQDALRQVGAMIASTHYAMEEDDEGTAGLRPDNNFFLARGLMLMWSLYRGVITTSFARRKLCLIMATEFIDSDLPFGLKVVLWEEWLEEFYLAARSNYTMTTDRLWLELSDFLHHEQAFAARVSHVVHRIRASADVDSDDDYDEDEYDDAKAEAQMAFLQQDKLLDFTPPEPTPLRVVEAVGDREFLDPRIFNELLDFQLPGSVQQQAEAPAQQQQQQQQQEQVHPQQ